PRANDAQDNVVTITGITVNGVAVNLGLLATLNPGGVGNGDVLGDLHESDVVGGTTASGVNPPGIFNAGGLGGGNAFDGKPFSVTAIGVETVAAGSPVNLSYDLLMTDGDGDGIVGNLDIALNPVITPLFQSGTFSGTVEEEHLNPALPAPAFPITA